jgi:hypothetical protein
MNDANNAAIGETMTTTTRQLDAQTKDVLQRAIDRWINPEPFVELAREVLASDLVDEEKLRTLCKDACILDDIWREISRTLIRAEAGAPRIVFDVLPDHD